MPTTSATSIVPAAGGSFLLESRAPGEVLTPEDLSEEQRQIAATAAQFARDEILPAAAAIEAKQPGAVPGLLRKAAALGFTSADWGPSDPLAVPKFIFQLRHRGHSEATVRRIVYENPLEFFNQSRNFQFKPAS